MTVIKEWIVSHTLADATENGCFDDLTYDQVESVRAFQSQVSSLTNNNPAYSLLIVGDMFPDHCQLTGAWEDCTRICLVIEEC